MNQRKTPTQFAPNEKMTRTNAFIISARGIQDDQMYAEDVLKSFKDADKIASGNRQEMAKAVELGLLSGFEDCIFRPQDHMTKEQLQKF